mmetsp:Transcript_104480/g.304996  ORF Transcript_104480/g.304996 Transcript_104480/m.304996 type:complete len:329 (-) Transcript_104480:313-1299(-)
MARSAILVLAAASSVQSVQALATSCKDLWQTCVNGCGSGAVFPNCVALGGSCTPYSFMPNEDNQDCSFMDSGKFYTSPFLQLSNVYSYQAFSASGYNDVWILHGCDGAGIQTDCAGDIMYLEHFDSSQPVAAENCYVGTYGHDHVQCPTFYHPGKQQSFPGYSCGWWRGYNTPVGLQEANSDGIGALGPKESPTDSYTGDYSSSLLGVLANCPTCAGGTALSNPYEGSNAIAYFTGASWPWICSEGGTKFEPYTGSSANCYCDNEPWNGRQLKGFLGEKPQYPFNAQFTYCGLYSDESTQIKLVCDFITLDNGEAKAQRGVELFPAAF